MKKLIIAYIVRKYAKKSGVLSFNKIPIRTIFLSIKMVENSYQKGSEDEFILNIIKTCFQNHFRTRYND
jgi:hypothetical protein